MEKGGYRDVVDNPDVSQTAAWWKRTGFVLCDVRQPE